MRCSCNNLSYPKSRARIAEVISGLAAGLASGLLVSYFQENSIWLPGIALWLLCVTVLFTINWGKRDSWICYFVVAVDVGWWIVAAFLAANPITGERNVHFVWLGLRITALGAGIPMLMFVVLKSGRWLLTGRKHWRIRFGKLDQAVMALGMLAPVALLIGVLHGNDIVLIVGDTYGFLFVPLVYFTIKHTVRSGQTVDFLRRVSGLFVIVALFVLLGSRFLYIKGTPLAGGGSISWILPIIFVSLLITHTKKNRFFYSILYALSLVAILLTFSRELWGVVVLSIPFIFFVSPKRTVLRVATRAAFVLLACALIVYNLPFVSSSIAEFQTRVISRVRSAFVPSQHLGEGSVRRAGIVGSLAEIAPLDYLLGKGAGAKYYHPIYQVTIHHIHVTPASIFFRTGLFGVIVFLFFCLSAVREAYHIMRARDLTDKDKVVVKSALIYFILSGIDSILTYGVVNDLCWGILLGLLAIISEKRLEEERACVASSA